MFATHKKTSQIYLKDFICVSSFCRFRTRQRVYRGRRPPGVGTHRYCRLCRPLKTWRVSVLIEQFSSLLQRERWDNDEMHVEAVTRGQATSNPVTRNLYLSLSSFQPLLYLSRPSSLTVSDSTALWIVSEKTKVARVKNTRNREDNRVSVCESFPWRKFCPGPSVLDQGDLFYEVSP